MIISRVISIVLRFLQFASAAIVLGIIAKYMDNVNKANRSPGGRFVYTIIIAVFALIASLILLVPFTASLTIFPLDILFFILWIISFGLLVEHIAPRSCEWGWSWNGRYHLFDDPDAYCQRMKTSLAFTFLSAMFWLMSGLLALWIVHRARGRAGEKRRWYRSHY